MLLVVIFFWIHYLAIFFEFCLMCPVLHSIESYNIQHYHHHKNHFLLKHLLIYLSNISQISSNASLSLTFDTVIDILTYKSILCALYFCLILYFVLICGFKYQSSPVVVHRCKSTLLSYLQSSVFVSSTLKIKTFSKNTKYRPYQNKNYTLESPKMAVDP